ncbi:MAG: DNA-3-methyladenine glycosylase [Gaiellales bacterium]
MSYAPLIVELLDAPAAECAPRLLGWTLLHMGVGGRIVEVEAYDGDEASHAFRGRTGRNGSMFAKAGSLYVYRSYGVHWCANLACGPVGHGAAVLVRALEPTNGLEQMRERRRVTDDRLLCSGPGRLTEALGITSDHDGLRADVAPFALRPPAKPAVYDATPRVGISKAAGLPWRFVERGSRWLSRGPRPSSP